ncbi:galactosylgalactosylxylosylprotein 3-beta-glucuronosyltransferase S isoform X1 [Bactrocera tryoni]|uniref:galactosylgalactosylxylosylprotein 3-beta-glucuronosyltransferase S isoform X1 n=2 Tax=Bactrocera tryoni TaxID=59916 RepID=UPI001A96859E|nr:galactosylgalactosylxylosylprotein 3-beta-glucuronosyltransferase S isoform X1 [Bactrocera tryoni]
MKNLLTRHKQEIRKQNAFFPNRIAADLTVGRDSFPSKHAWSKSSTIPKLGVLFVVICFLLYVLWGTLDVTIADSTDCNLSDETVHARLNESYLVCNEVLVDHRVFVHDRALRDYEALPMIYFVTPTYPRREQIPELIRLAYTLLHVPRIHWILANDLKACNAYIDGLLKRFGLPFTHLASPMPEFYRKKKPMPRGVANRRAAIQWLRQRNITNGILYFGDDDNTYDLKLFSEIRNTQRVSMFPVGLIEEYSVSGPVVRKGKVVGFLDSWVAERRWPVDMAGFATNLAYMAEYPNASMPYKPGYEEDLFLRSIRLNLNIIEPKANNCTEILVWHTQTKNRERTTLRISNKYLDDRSNLGTLIKSLDVMGIANSSDNEGRRAVISKNGKAKPLSYFLSTN